MLIQGGNLVRPLRLYPNRFLDKAQSREVPCLAKVYPEVVVRWLGNRREFPSGHTHPKNDRTEDLRWWSVLLDRFLGQNRLRLREQPLPEPLSLDRRAVLIDKAGGAELVPVPVIF